MFSTSLSPWNIEKKAQNVLMMILKRIPVTLTSNKSYSENTYTTLHTGKKHMNSTNQHSNALSCLQVSQKHQKKWETTEKKNQLNRHQSERVKNVIERKQKPTQTTPVFIDREKKMSKQSKAKHTNILKFQANTANIRMRCLVCSQIRKWAWG